MNRLSPKESSTTNNRQSPSGYDTFPTPPSSNVSLASPAESPFPLSPAYNEQHSTPNTPSPINQPLPPNSNQSSLQTSTESPKPPPSLAALIAERWNQATSDEKRRYLELQEESKGA